MVRRLGLLGVCLLGSAGLIAGFRAYVLDDDDARLARGQELLASGKPAEAIEALGQVAGDPARSDVALEARLLGIRALTQAKKADDAAAAARTLAEALPASHHGRGRAEMLLAEAFEALGKRDEAARLHGEAAARVLGEGHRARVAGYYLTFAGTLEKGTPSTDPLKPATPPDPAAAALMYQKALEILTGGKPLAAVTIPRARNLVAAGTGDPTARELGALLEQKGLAPAEEAEARWLRAKALLLANDPAAARTEIEKLLLLPSVQESAFGPQGLLLLGDAILAQGGGPERLKEAVSAWGRFLALYPDRAEAPGARQKIAETLFSGGLPAEAIPAFEALAADAKAEKAVRARAVFGVAECERQLQHFDRAREALRRFLAAHPDDARAPEAQRLLPELLLEKAQARRKEKDDAGAVAALREYLEEFPLSDKAAAIAVETGLVLRGMKRIDDAAAALLAARDRYRQHDREQAARAGHLLGVIEEEDRKDLEKAVAVWQEVVKDFAGTQAAGAAAARLAELEAVELGLLSPRLFVPGETVELTLTARNVKDATLRLYRLDAREYFERRGTLDGAADIEVALVKSDRTIPFPVPDYRRYRQSKVPVQVALEDGKPLPPGAWLVAAEAEERRSVVLVIVSGVRLVVKESPHEVFCWAVNAASGEPQEGVEVLVRGPEVATKLQTGKDGVARLAHDRPRGRCEVLGVFTGSIAPGLAPEPPAPAQQTLAPRAAFSLDRPIYRPGHEVRFRAVLRGVEAGAFVTPADAEVKVRLVDPRGRVVGSAALRTGPFGTIHGAFALPPEGAIGDHALQADFAGQTFSERVVVSEYRRPEYEVSVAAKKPVVRPGDEVDAEISVAYWFGGPLAQASFEWRAFKAPHALDPGRYLSHAWYLRATASERPDAVTPDLEMVASGGGSLDLKGKATISFRTAGDGAPRRYVIQAYVRDTTGQWVAGQGTAYAGPVDRFAVVVAEKRTVRAGESVEARVVTPDLGYRPKATTGRLRALLERRGDGGRVTLDPVAEAAVDTGTEGEASVKLELPKAGDVVLRFEGEDAGKAPVVAETRVVVTGERADLAQEAQLRFEREVVKGGERVPMHLSVPEPGRPALLTFEGERVLGYQILKPAMASAVYAIEIAEAYAPNVVVSIAAPWKEKLLEAQDRLVVLRYLQVEVSAAKEKAAPGEEVKLAVTTKDQLGRPAAASVALRAVDAALSDLGGSGGEDPRFVFNRDVRPHLVRTSSSFAFRFEGRTALLDPDLVALAEESRRVLAVHESLSRGLAELKSLTAAPAPAPTLTPPDASVMEAGEAMDEGRDKSEEKSKSALGVGGGGGGSTRKSSAFGGRSASRRNHKAGEPAAPGAPRPEKDGSDRGTFFDLADAPAEAEASLGYALRYRADSRAGKDWKGDRDRLGLEDLYKKVVADPEAAPMIEPVLREKFLEVAGWWPDVVTGENGEASVTLALPDNLTTWEVLGAGTTKGVAVGQGRASVRSAKDVMVRLDPPRFLTSKDEVLVPAVVHSNIEGKVAFKTEARSLEPGILDLGGAADASFEIDGPGSAVRSLQLKAKAGGTAKLEARALSSRASDALKAGVPVLAFGDPWTHAATATFVDRHTFPFALGHEPVPGSGSYRVIVQAGMDAEVLEGLAFLAGYPHACLEQSVHRWAAAMILNAARKRAGRPGLVDDAKLAEQVQRGIAGLLAFQNDDGGFGYWPKGPSDAWATALALEHLARAHELGHPVDAGFLAAARSGALNLLNKGGAEADARSALALALARAGHPAEAAVNALFRERAALSVAGFARLLLAVHRSGREGMVPQLLDELKARRRGGDGFPFAGKGPATWHASDLEATALALLAFETAGAGPGDTAPLVAAVRRGLRTRDGSTKAVAVALEGLAAHVAGEGAVSSDGKVTVLLDGAEVAEGRVGAGEPVLVLPIPPEKVKTGDHRIEVRKDGGGEATCRVVLRNMKPADKTAADGNLLTVTRRVTAFQDPWRKIEDFEPGWSVIRPESRPKPQEPPSLDQAVAGWKITVELKVQAREEAAWLVLEDPLFAGLEVIEEGVRGAIDRHERRDGRMVFFKNRLRKGEALTITYPCYVVHEGRFFALPARAEEMYAPERYGRSGSASLQVFPDPNQLARLPERKPTPDELFHGGLRAFEEGNLEGAVRSLAALPGAFDLQDEVHDRTLGTLLVAYLRLERWTDAVRTRDALQLRNPGKTGLEAADRERLGRAYRAAGEPGQARDQFQSVVLEAFGTEAAVAETLRGLGQPLAAVEHLRTTLWRYPPAGEPVDRQRTIADWLLRIPAPEPEEKLRSLPPAHRVRWREAMRTWLSVMAWNPGSAVAEDAAFRRIGQLGQLGLLEPLVSECDRYLERFPRSARADEATYVRAAARFGLERYDDAAADALRVWQDAWPKPAPQPPGPSAHRDPAGYLLGKVAHVRGDYPKAVEWYGKVRERVPDAQQSWAFLTARELRIEPIVRAAPDQEVKLPFECRNLAEVKVQVYPVDLSVLFAVKKSFDRLSTADLSGITPAEEKSVKPDLPPYTAGAAAAPLGTRKKGASLVVLRGEDRAATTLLLVTSTTVRIQREAGSVRVWLVDGAGRPVPGARVKLGCNNRIFHSGETDERGLLDVKDPGGGTITVVAEKGDDVAVGTGG